MKIENIMTTRIVTVGMDDTLAQIKEIFDHVSFHHLMVIEDEVLVGIISDRDLLRAIGPKTGTIAETAVERADLKRRAHQIMSRQPITLTAQASIVEAVAIFNRFAISCIPVVDGEGRPRGIVSWRDVMKTL